MLFDLGLGAHDDTAATRRIGGTNTGIAHDNTAGREIGAFDAIHDLRHTGFGVVNEQANTVHDLTQVVRRNIGCHTDRNTHRAIHEQVGETRRQNLRLLGGIVKVRHEVYRFFFDICEHIQRHLAHARLGITVGSGGVAVDGTEVTVTVNERIPQ